MDYSPWVIQIINSFIFVQAGQVKSIFVYDLNSSSLKKKIDNPAEYFRLSEVNSNVYRFNSKSKSVLFYNENGKLKEEITINNVGGNFLSDA
jgi:hypothetical protein